ncbi:hypothetical protein [Thermomonas sp.]|uniref:hypothetical protein n=1 Tax=Thermomonas sp. TaxID=1971895 RepID=UPI0035B01DD1
MDLTKEQRLALTNAAWKRAKKLNPERAARDLANEALAAEEDHPASVATTTAPASAPCLYPASFKLTE